MSQENIGSYRLCGLLPGASSTYLARHLESGQRFALKKFSGVRSEEWRLISRALAEAPKKVDGMCAVTEISVQADFIYAVAPLIRGKNVSQIMRALSHQREVLHSPVHAWVTMRVIGELASTLAARRLRSSSDGSALTPVELFVTFDGTTCVLDPRWAKLRGITSGPGAGAMERALAYALPKDLVREEAPEAGEVWALCVMMWELLCGFRLFRRQSFVDTLRAVTRREVPSLCELNEAIPLQFETMLACLIADPGRMTLSQLSEVLHRASKVKEEDAPDRVRSWMQQLFPGETGYETAPPSTEPGPLDRLLESDKRLLSMNDDSTTYTMPPPNLHEPPIVELAWLDEGTFPSVRTIVPTKPPSKPSRESSWLRVALALAAVMTCGIIALFSLPPPTLDYVPMRVLGGTSTQYDTFDDLPTMLDAPAPAPELVPWPKASRDSVPKRTAKAPEEAPGPRSDADALVASAAPAERKAVAAAARGDVLVVAPAEARISLGGKELAVGTYRGSVPVGLQRFSIALPGQQPTILEALVSATSMTLVSIE